MVNDTIDIRDRIKKLVDGGTVYVYGWYNDDGTPQTYKDKTHINAQNVHMFTLDRPHSVSKENVYMGRYVTRDQKEELIKERLEQLNGRKDKEFNMDILKVRAKKQKSTKAKRKCRCK